MRAKRLRVENWRQHVALDVEFGDFTTIRGPNGSGKTNIVDAVVFALTGEGRGDGDICQISGAARAIVEFWFEHREVACYVSRTIHRGKSPTVVLHVGEEIYRGTRKAGDAITKLLQIDANMISKYIFVPQWEIFGFIREKDSERAKTFGQLFGTAKAEKIWDALGKVKLPDVSVTIDGQAVRERLVAIDGLLLDARSRHDAMAQRSATMQAGAAARANLIAMFAVSETKRRELEAADASLKKAADQMAAARLNATPLRDQLEQARVDAASSQAAAADSWRCLQAWSAYEMYQRTLAGVSNEYVAAAKNLADLQARMPVPSEPIVEQAAMKALEDEIVQARVHCGSIEKFLASCDPERGIAACPTCGTPTAAGDLGEKIAKARASLSAWKEYGETRRLRLRASVGHWGHMTSWTREVEIAQQRVTAATLAANNLQPVEAPATPKDVAQAAFSRANELSQRLAALEAQVGKINVEVGRLEAAHHAASEHQAAIQAALAAVSVTREQRDAAVAEETEFRALLTDQAVAAGHVKALQAEQDEKQGMLRRFEEEQSLFWRVKNLAMHIEAVRHQFHREQLPASVHRHCLGLIRNRIDRVLARFSKPFRVGGIDDVRFILQYADRRVHGEELLSGGEKVVFAIAFRFAVNSTFASELGLLCLDEPTAGLDEDTLGDVQLAMQELRDVSRASGLQLILITHERVFDAQCDKIIDLADGARHARPGPAELKAVAG